MLTADIPNKTKPHPLAFEVNSSYYERPAISSIYADVTVFKLNKTYKDDGMSDDIGYAGLLMKYQSPHKAKRWYLPVDKGLGAC